MSKEFNSYISGLKEALANKSAFTIVMGNEAADLDSMASAVSYAYYLHLTKPQLNPLPLLNIPRADFKLRTEAVFLFQEAKIDLDALLFLDDMDPNTIKSSKKMDLILIDHNKLSAGQAYLKDSIIEILDHHADENNYPASAEVDIRPVGSAATLVAERFLKTNPEALDQQLGTLLSGTILLDTVNLDPAAERVTETDSKTAEPLMKKAQISPQALFDKLQYEKFNVSSLGSYDLLRKDYKEWIMGTTKCGIGSVLLSVEEWLTKDNDILSAFNTYLKERELDVLLAMNAFTNPDFTRNLVVYVPDSPLRKTIIDFLEAADLGLDLIETNYSEETGIVFYHQGNLGISRKKLQPLLVQLFGS